MKKIQEVVDSMLEQYQAYGVSKISIETYRTGYCSSIIRFCNQKSNGFYSAKILDDYLVCYKQKLDYCEIGATYYSIVARIVRLIKAVGNNGVANFARIHLQVQYNPSEEHWNLTDKIIKINNVSHGSVKNLHTQIRHIFCFLEENSIFDMEVTDAHFFEYLRSVSESNKGSMSETMRAVRLVSSYLKENGNKKLKTDFSLLPYKKAAVHMIEPYSPEEIRRIVEAIDVHTPMGIRDFAIMLLECDTGLRGVDIIHLCLQDIDWRHATLSIMQKKTGHPITQALRGAVLNALADYVLKIRPQNCQRELFLSTRPPYHALKGSYSLDYLIEKYCKIAGVEKKTRRSFHSLRRSFATELSIKGIAIGEISELLGHRTIRSDKPYLSYNKNQISFVAADFSEIPITNGIYADLLSTAKRG